MVYATGMYSSERVMASYRLPDGTIVQVDDSAAKGAKEIAYTLPGGVIVIASRISL